MREDDESTKEGNAVTNVLVRSSRRKLAATVIGVGISLGVASTAFAHSSAATLYDTDGIRRGHGGITASHHYVYACDDSNDDRGVYTLYFADGPRGPNSILNTVTDANGSAPGCTQTYTRLKINKYRVCRKSLPVRAQCTATRTP